MFEELGRRGQPHRSTSLVNVFDSVKVIEVNPEQAPPKRVQNGATSVRQSDGGYIWFSKSSNYLNNTVAELIHLSRSGNNDYSDKILDQAVESIIGTNTYNVIDKRKEKSPGNVAHYVINTACYTAFANAR